MTQLSPVGFLPAGYLEKMNTLLGKDYPAYCDSLSCLPVRGLRLNTLKMSPEAFSHLAPGLFGLETLPWIGEGFKPDETAYALLARHPYYYAGLYYLQEPSAMTPASRLPVAPGDHVLDLCAAPGGKTTQLLMRLQGQGMLLANDISASRAQALKRNLQTAGAVNAFVTAEEPAKLARHFAGHFDAVLVDAPCSGEGMFRREPSMVRAYEEKGPDFYAPLQSDILEEAVIMLRPGGHLMFSTCTFSPEENEANVLRLLDAHPDLHLVPIEPYYDGFAPGALPGTEKCVRIYPHRMDGEGQFLALFRRDGEKKPRKAAKASYAELVGGLFRLPEGMRPERGIRYLMTGLEAGTLKGKRVLPTQPLAMALGSRQWPQVLGLTAGDGRVEKYLKGETIEVSPGEIQEGEGAPAGLPLSIEQKDILVTVDGLPLGFGSASRGLLKNKRPAGWRMT